MRIAQICPRYTPYIGGVETHVREISERLVKKGFEVEVLTTDSSKELSREEIIGGVKVKRFKSWAPDEAYYFSRELQKYLMKNSGNYDIMHAHLYHAFPALYCAQAKKSNVLIFTSHYVGKGQTFFRNLLHVPYKFIIKKIFEKCDKVICVSNYEKDLLMRKFKLKDEKVLVIPNGVNREELSKYKWNPRSFPPKITYSGRLERRQKNIDKLIQAFKILLHEYCIDAELAIIGRGPYEKGMKRLIKKLELQNNVSWKPWLPRCEYLEELVSTSIFVTPSEHECYCIAAAEAIVLCVPTLVADSSALSDYVKTGWALGVTSPITPQRLASAMYEALITPHVKNCSSNKGILSWDQIVTKLIKQAYQL